MTEIYVVGIRWGDWLDVENQQIEIFETLEKAKKHYDGLQRDLREYVDDTGFTGEELVFLVRLRPSMQFMMPITKTNKDGKSWSFKWLRNGHR